MADNKPKPSDKHKVARILADMLGVEDAETLSPDVAVNTGLRNLRKQRITPEMHGIVMRLVDLARQVGIKIEPGIVKEQSMMSLKDYIDFVNKADSLPEQVPILPNVSITELDPTEVGHTFHPQKAGAETRDDHVRRMKVKYKTDEQTLPGEEEPTEVSSLKPAVVSADYKTTKTGKKYRAHRIVFEATSDKHPAEDQVARSIKAGYGDGEYASKATGARHKVSFDGKHYRAGARRSATLSGLLHAIDGKVADTKTPTATTPAKHPSEDQVARSIKMGHGSGEYASKATGNHHKVEFDGKHYRTGLMRSATLSGLLHTIDKTVKNKSPMRSEETQLAEEMTDELPELTDDDLSKLAKSITDPEHILHLYDDDELTAVDGDDEILSHVKEEVLDEVMSRVERIRARVRFLRNAPKRERRMQIALKRHSDAKTINKRARRLAISLIKQKIMKKPAAELSVQEKERVEGIIARMKPAIDRLSLKLVPRIRKIEQDRLTHATATETR